MPRIASASGVLDDPVGESLRGHHAHLARRVGAAATYLPGYATFATVSLSPTESDWDDLVRLLGPGQLADLFSAPVTAPAAWEPVFNKAGCQMVGNRMYASPASRTSGASVVELGGADVPAMLELTSITWPGPLWPRSHELGRYLGIYQGGDLVAMVGERLRPPGWTEIASVCTAPAARGRGLATRLVLAALHRITARGDRPFLHVAADNESAIGLYEGLGFGVRREVCFHGYRTPEVA